MLLLFLFLDKVWSFFLGNLERIGKEFSIVG
jgi:hypothetical protein